MVSIEQNNTISGHEFKVQDVLVPFHYKAKQVRKTSASPSIKAKQKPEVAALETQDKGMTRKLSNDRLPNGSQSVDAKDKPGEKDGEKARNEKPVVFQRYCHVYKQGELENLFLDLSSWVKVDHVYFDAGNCE